MKKVILIFAVLLVSATAFAQSELKPTFKFNVWGNAFAMNERTVGGDYNQYQAIRLRPKFTAAMGNVSVVTRFEIDQFYGEMDSDKGADLGADNKVVEVKNAYVKIKDMGVKGLTLKTGVAGYSFPLSFSDDCGMAQASFSKDIVTVDLAYVGVLEGDLSNAKDDAYFGAVKVGVDVAGFTVSPGVMYGVANEEAGDLAVGFYALDLRYSVGALDITMLGSYASGKDEVSDRAYSGFAADLAVEYGVSSALQIAAFGAYYSGQDDSSDATSFAASADLFDGIESSNARMYILQDVSYIDQVGVNDSFNGSEAGFILAGVSAAYKMGKMNASGNIGYALVADDTTTGGETAIGFEIDAHVGYEVAPKSELWIEGAYLAAGEALGDDVESPLYGAIGIRTSL